jgi:hypothetical protein
MLVVDREKSEHGPQRRKSPDGRALHCCCICLKVEPWSERWTVYCSFQELDDGVALPKFCSAQCQARGGSEAQHVTAEMKAKAKAAEWREPELVYREATEQEKYNAAVAAQRCHNQR